MGLLHQSLKAIKNGILPKGESFRRIPVGMMAGNVMKIDFFHQFRQYLSLYEFELNSHFKALVKPNYRCFDVGGKGGYSALMLATLSKGAQVVTFECEDEAITDLLEVIAKNKWKIDLVKAYVSDKVDDENKTIDWAAQKYFTPDFIKLDIEGAEVMALKGAHQVLSQRKPHIIIETHGLELENECIRILKSYGYDPKIVDQSKILPEKRLTFAHNRWLVAEGRA